MAMKGMNPLISLVVFIAVILSAVALTITVGRENIDKMEDSAAIEEAQDFLSRLDEEIRSVASEHKGTRSRLSLKFNKGEFNCNKSNNSIYYRLDSSAEIISEGASKKVGNLVLNSSNGVETVKLTYSNINISECDRISPGLHNVFIENLGVSNEKRKIGVTRE